MNERKKERKRERKEGRKKEGKERKKEVAEFKHIICVVSPTVVV